MTIYTDASFTIELSGVSLTEASEIHVTFKQDNRVIDISDPELVGESTLQLTLTQKQTSKFTPENPVKVQVNFVIGGIRKASSIGYVYVTDNLLRGKFLDG